MFGVFEAGLPFLRRFHRRRNPLLGQVQLEQHVKIVRNVVFIAAVVTGIVVDDDFPLVVQEGQLGPRQAFLLQVAVGIDENIFHQGKLGVVVPDGHHPALGVVDRRRETQGQPVVAGVALLNIAIDVKRDDDGAGKITVAAHIAFLAGVKPLIDDVLKPRSALEIAVVEILGPDRAPILILGVDGDDVAVQIHQEGQVIDVIRIHVIVHRRHDGRVRFVPVIPILQNGVQPERLNVAVALEQVPVDFVRDLLGRRLQVGGVDVPDFIERDVVHDHHDPQGNESRNEEENDLLPLQAQVVPSVHYRILQVKKVFTEMLAPGNPPAPYRNQVPFDGSPQYRSVNRPRFPQ